MSGDVCATGRTTSILGNANRGRDAMIAEMTANELLQRITHDPAVMGGRPCIRGLRITVGTLVGLLATGRTIEDVLAAYPYLERDDIYAALSFAAWRSQEVDLPLKAS